MDLAHLLAAVSRAKAISRERGSAINDELLGYLCKCADVSGRWWSMLSVPAPAPALQGEEQSGSPKIAADYSDAVGSDPASTGPPPGAEPPSVEVAGVAGSPEPQADSHRGADVPEEDAEDREGEAEDGTFDDDRDPQATDEATVADPGPQAEQGDDAGSAHAANLNDGEDMQPEARSTAQPTEAAQPAQKGQSMPQAKEPDLDAVVKAIEILAHSIVSAAQDPNCPSVRLARIQLAMEASFRQERTIAANEHQERVTRINTKMQQILRARKKNITAQEMNRLYDQVIYFVCIAGRMEEALHDAAAEQEIRAAVESVFPLSMLSQFLTLPAVDRELQLNELPYIVLGICLYNQATGAAEGRPLNASLDATAVDSDALVLQCNAEVDAIHASLRGYAGAIAKLLYTGKSGDLALAQYTAEALELFQVSTHLQQLMMALTVARQALDDLRNEMSNLVAEADELTRSKAAVPKQQILPIFYQVGHMFESLLDEQRGSRVNEGLLQTLFKIRSGLHASLSQIAIKTAAANTLEISALASSGDASILAAHAAAQPAGTAVRVRQDDIAHMDVSLLAFGGADVVALVQNEGLPAAAVPQVGAVLYPETNGVMYGFSSEAALEKFMQRPAAYVAAASEVLTRQPHLIPVFGFMDNELPRFVSEVVDVGYGAIKCDYGTQTPVHFVDRHIDHTYHWNEWVLRKHALRAANLQTKKTSSTQSIAKTFRRDNETQHWQPRVAATQCAVNKGQAMAKKLRYVTGLRGDPVSMKMSIVSLELDLGQPHQL